MMCIICKFRTSEYFSHNAPLKYYLQVVTDHLMKIYEELKDIASPEINYHRYRQEIRIIHQAPCVPHLGVCCVCIGVCVCVYGGGGGGVFL